MPVLCHLAVKAVSSVVRLKVFFNTLLVHLVEALRPKVLTEMVAPVEAVVSPVLVTELAWISANGWGVSYRHGLGRAARFDSNMAFQRVSPGEGGATKTGLVSGNVHINTVVDGDGNGGSSSVQFLTRVEWLQLDVRIDDGKPGIVESG